jgi:hypothetical protein
MGIGAILWLIGGLVITGFAAAMTYEQLKFRRKSKSAVGTIVDFEPGSEYHIKHPIVEFVDEKKNTIKFRSDFGTNMNVWKLGRKVLVLYLPDDPENSRIDKFPANWFFTILFYFIGFIFIWVSLMVRAQR